MWQLVVMLDGSQWFSWCKLPGEQFIPGKSKSAKKEKNRREGSSLLHSCLSRRHICVVFHLCVPGRHDKRDTDTIVKIRQHPGLLCVFLSWCLTLSTVISSSASAVVSSSSVLACWSWLSRAWRAACRLLIWDSRSCKDKVTSVTWRLISSFCSSCSSPICRGGSERISQRPASMWYGVERLSMASHTTTHLNKPKNPPTHQISVACFKMQCYLYLFFLKFTFATAKTTPLEISQKSLPLSRLSLNKQKPSTNVVKKMAFPRILF